MERWDNFACVHLLRKEIRVSLTSASGALVKESKCSKFYIEKNITYTLKKLTTKIIRQFTTFGSLTSIRNAMFSIC
jgi:hypothetical protein